MVTNLTPREVEVLRAYAEGGTQAYVADTLHISQRTVSNHLRNIYEKLGVGSNLAAFRVLGWLRVPRQSAGAGDA